MSIAFAIAGLVLLAAVVWDVLSTATGVGGGPITRNLEKVIWQGLLKANRLTRTAGPVDWGGGVALAATVGFWILLTWFGWALLFVSDNGSVFLTGTSEQVDLWGRIYFAGFTVATLGVGDLRPIGPVWQVLTVLAALNGLMVITFAISYVLPVIGAATNKRGVATLIATLGLTPQEMVLAAWDCGGRSCRSLGTFLTILAPALTELEEQHITNPILHFFSARPREKSAAINIAVLDEALTIIELGLAPSAHPEALQLQPVRKAIEAYLHTMPRVIPRRADPPPPPSLALLRERGLPVVADEQFEERLDAVAERRKKLATLLQNDGWSWEVVFGEGGTEKEEEEG